MSYNLLSGSVNFVGATQGTIEDVVDTHTTQTISGTKTLSTVTASNSHVSTRLQVGGTHAIDHAVCVTGDISASVNVSASAFYANGVLLEAGGAVSAVANGANNRIATFSSADALNGEANLSFTGNKLNVTGTVGVSSNISGSSISGSWAGDIIRGAKIQLAANKGIANDSGLTLSTTGVTAQSSPAGSSRVFIDESGIKYATIANILANNAAVTSATQLANTNQVVLSNGAGSITNSSNLTFAASTLSVTGKISGSTTLEVASHITSSGDVVVVGNVTASAIEIADYITHAGDSDSFFGFGSDNNIAFVAGGVQMLTNYGNLSPKRVQVGGSDFRVNTSGLDFQINNSDGFVGIGDTSPSAPLEISSSNNPQFKITYHGSNAATFRVESNGNLTINPNGTTTIDSALSVNGNTTLGDASGDVTTINGTAVTIPNGLNFDSNTMFISSSNNRVGIGTVTPAAPLEIFNAGTQLQLSYNASDNATIAVDDNGFLTFTPSGEKTIVKHDLIIQDDASTDTIVQIFDSSDDGVIAGYANNIITTKIHANGTSYFNGGSVAIGAESAGHSLSISGSFAVSGSSVRARLANSIFEISSSTTIQSGGQALFEVKSPTNPNLFGISEGGVVALNIVPSAFDAQMYISGAAVVGAPATAIAASNLHANSVTFFLDEGNNKLIFKTKDSLGQVKTGSVSLS